MITKIAEEMVRPGFLTSTFGMGKRPTTIGMHIGKYRTDPKFTADKNLHAVGKTLKKGITNIGAAGLTAIPTKYNPLAKSALGSALGAAIK